MQCLVINGKYFYDIIDKVEFEPEYSYVLSVEKEQIYTEDDVPADAGVYRYKLIEIIKKHHHPK